MHEHGMHEEPLQGSQGGWWDAAWRGLDQAHELITGGETLRGMETLFSRLAHARALGDTEEWKRFCQQCRAHPIRKLVHQDPITARSFERPRGYSGDAGLLDLMYETQTPERQRASPLGQEICQYVYEEPGALSVRERRDLLAQRIDAIADDIPGASILSVACGHLREACLSHAVTEGRFGRFLALDQDPQSLAVVERELAPHGVEAVQSSVKALLKGERKFADLDFIYAAGLYDYLPQPVAIKLTTILFSMLRSGGRLLLANFTDRSHDSGYMEAFMDWWLLYREPQEVQEWLRDIPAGELARHQLFWDSPHNVVYLEAIHR
jgi:extracellular factor (EF) 3-hydroxypalmitic acid methyl ester biosynthesis protein